MLFFSSLIKSIHEYKPAADRLFATLESSGTEYRLLDSTRDIWLRDFMPVRTKNGKYISFRYEPSYLTEYKDIRTDYRKDIAPLFDFPVIYSNNNIVLHPQPLVILSNTVVFIYAPLTNASADSTLDNSESVVIEDVGFSSKKSLHDTKEANTIIAKYLLAFIFAIPLKFNTQSKSKCPGLRLTEIIDTLPKRIPLIG